MKMVRGFAAAVMVALLAACGGGGSGGSSSEQSPAPVVKFCPDEATPIPAKGTTFCPFVNISAPSTLGSVDPQTFLQGLTVQFDGGLDPGSIMKNVVLWEGAVDTGTSVAGTTSLAAGNRDLTFVPTQRLAYGQSFVLVMNLTDSVGRPVSSTIPFTTTAMVCADNAVWSNPATFSDVYRDCVADVGIQTQVDPTFNTVQDDTCVVTVGTPLTSACKAYMANGTMLLANTSIVVGGHAVMWAVYSGTDKSDNFVLLDVNDSSNPVPVATFVSPAPLKNITGNATGMFARTTDGKGSQLTVNSSSNIVWTCVLGC
ncbi:MAG: hypothetical protein NUW01_19090 [Gemmatimonadaceae bacterium]|nr:hypothetical protein [Gemmatimonadaceae bacterium]